MPPACDQQGPVQCGAPASGGGAVGTVTDVTTSPSTPAVGEAVTLTATVTSQGGLTPAGSVQFSVGGTLLGGPVTLDSSGVATTTETFTTTGAQGLEADFTPTDPTAFQPSGVVTTVTVLPSSDATAITVTTTVAPTGTFTFTAPTNATVTMTVTGDTATGALVPITITETRNTYPGWSLVGQATDFTNPTSNPPGDFSGNFLGWAPDDTALASGAVLGPVVTPSAPGLDTTAAVLASATAGTGFGTSTVGANLTLTIPPTAPSGAYSSTLTLTANPASP
jgi:hypothetical protein